MSEPRRFSWLSVIAVLALNFLPFSLSPSLPPAHAQLSSEELRREQIETIEALRSTEDISGGSSRLFGDLGRKTGWAFEYGAPFSTTYTGGDNGSDRNTGAADANDHSYDYEIKPFLKIGSADKKAKFYVRLTAKYTEAKKNTVSVRGNNFIEPTVDMLYWEKKFDGRTKGVQNKFVVGRQYMQVGRGIAFSAVEDGVLYEQTGLAKKKGEWKVFAFKQKPGEDRLDLSASGAGRSKHYAAGIRGKYSIRSSHSPLFGQSFFTPTIKMSLYTVQFKDRNTDVNFAGSAFQKHKYEAQYYGAVSEGRITPDLQYWTEYIYEGGKTFSHGTAAAPSQEVDIDADMLTFGLKYYWKGDRSPTLFGEFTQASGDPDATATSSISSQNGSAPGTKDSRFIPSGGLAMGSALSPTLNNMQVYKIGGSIKPFALSDHRIIQDVSLQPEFYIYNRRTGNSGAAGNDGVIQNNTGSRIGEEINFSVSWRLMSDLTYQLKYGHFNPGSAYLLKSSETYWRFKVSVDL